MALKESDITEGFYWVRDKMQPQMNVCSVVNSYGALYFGIPYDNSGLSAEGFEEFSKFYDFIARIEPPEGA